MVLLPENVKLSFNGNEILSRKPYKIIENISLPTVIFNEEKEAMTNSIRKTNIELYKTIGNENPFIYELGLPVCEIPDWELPYHINVLQKTPLDKNRDNLPDTFKNKLKRAVICVLETEVKEFFEESGEMPSILLNDKDAFDNIPASVKNFVIKETFGKDIQDIVRDNHFDKDRFSKIDELENEKGKKIIDLKSAPLALKGYLKENTGGLTDVHNDLCGIKFSKGFIRKPNQAEKRVLDAISYIASSILKTEVTASPVEGEGFYMTFDKTTKSISVNYRVRSMWGNPFKNPIIGVILHEVAHDKHSGHSNQHNHEIERMAGKLCEWWIEAGHYEAKKLFPEFFI
jgi:hypothetical protein